MNTNGDYIAPIPHPERSPELQAAYDQARREFSEADLAKYYEPEDGVPLEDVIREMEAIHSEGER